MYIILANFKVLQWSIWKDATRPVIKLGDALGVLCISQAEALTGSSSLVPLFIAAITFDLSIFGLTFYKGLQARRSSPIHLLEVTFRDGNLYFGAIFWVNLGTLLLILKEPLSPYVGTINVQFSSVITVVLVSRLFLNLKEAAYRSRYFATSSLAFYSGISFVSFPPVQLGSSTLSPVRPRSKADPKTLRHSFGTLLSMDFEDLCADLQSIGESDSLY
ncbi:hypothetical protein M422DRAFT_263614 [Sphaerobolus stellatus SS14]|uniref:Uncharacterized protein n=1 Tax=Sphaerobolus stellatus (strain SS14) TaxID=990650 RepID=A0A0C9UHH0_SPHS4|nr:hypothetical protein M422DRAFT_263614 [Sphaerobolus stellatus SS14]